MPSPQNTSIYSDPCPCEACRNRRIEARTFRIYGGTPFFVGEETMSLNRNMEGTDHDGRFGGLERSARFRRTAFTTVLLDILRFVVRFCFMTLCVAIMVILYAFQLVYKIYYSRNRFQILTMILIGIIAILAIHAYSAVRSSRPKREDFKSETSFFKKLCPIRFLSKKNNFERNSAGALDKSSNRNRKFSFTQKCDEPVSSTNQYEKAQEIMNKLKWYSYPMEMKRPPQLLVYARDYFLR